MADSKLYFAYGSNINLDQMACRCPAAKVVGPVTLEGWELLFRGNNAGHGVATIAPKEGCTVHGLLWQISPQCEWSLDRYEGYPTLYDKAPVKVKNAQDQEITVMAYVMTERYQFPSMPSQFYYGGIEEGYRQNGLPVGELKKAWDHSVREVHEATERINASASRPPRRKDSYER